MSFELPRYLVLVSVLIYFAFDYFDAKRIRDEREELIRLKTYALLQKLTMLTITAVALLFSIYQVKPSPFCVLDELDAPLDESNINRFLDVLRGFVETSQFIVITHNKRTIAMGDAIYGVTMQERGVSKILSMKFNRGETPASSGRQVEVASAAPDAPRITVPEPQKPDDQEFVMAK